MQPTPADVRRIEEVVRRVEAALAAGARAPFFGHFRVATAGREADILLGTSSRVAPGVVVLDWLNAPLAEVFFAYHEGEEYELDVGGRIVEGRVLEKHLISWAGRDVDGVAMGGRWFRREGGGWAAAEPVSPWRVPPRLLEERTPFRSPLDVQLDPAQQRVVDLPEKESVLVLGEAGFGKTTVALHRLLSLRERGRKNYRGAVVVPTEGLRRLTELVLERRAIRDIDVFTYDGFAAKAARRTFRGLPKRESVGESAEVVALKRHPALRPVLEEFARGKPARSDRRASREDLEHLFGDRAYMDRVVAAADGALATRAAAIVTEHTRVQFLQTTEVEYAHVRQDQLETVDGMPIDAGTPTEDANSIDPEDYAVLFELERLRAIAAGDKPAMIGRFDCVVVDEAQEFAALELALVGRCVRKGGALIVAGDAAQQVDPASFFAGWDRVMEELGAPEAKRAVLEVNYRCPPDVTAFARAVLAPEAPRPESEPSITRARHEAPLHLALWLTEQIREIEREDSSASVAVICRNPASARMFARALGHALAPALALGGEFEFRPGTVVSAVQEVKGLEFDYVIIPDATPSAYPDLPESRRALYVAATRATHRLVIAAAGNWSPIIPGAASPGPDGAPV